MEGGRAEPEEVRRRKRPGKDGVVRERKLGPDRQIDVY